MNSLILLVLLIIFIISTLIFAILFGTVDRHDCIVEEVKIHDQEIEMKTFERKHNKQVIKLNKEIATFQHSIDNSSGHLILDFVHKPCSVNKNERLLTIITATYYRQDKSSIKSLRRALLSVQSQSHTNWLWYIIGDGYEHPQEVISLLSEFNDDRISFENMDEPGERGKLKQDQLWISGGTTAVNIGVKKMFDAGNDWYVHLDDDDFWNCDHLESINDGIETDKEVNFVFTQGHYFYSPFPRSPDYNITNALPESSNLIHSSIAANLRNLNIPVISLELILQKKLPGDIVFYQTCKSKPNFKSAFVPNITVNHLTQQGVTFREDYPRKLNRTELKVPGWVNKNMSCMNMHVSRSDVHKFKECKLSCIVLENIEDISYLKICFDTLINGGLLRISFENNNIEVQEYLESIFYSTYEMKSDESLYYVFKNFKSKGRIVYECQKLLK
jgi:hypothetical protein